MRPTGELFQRLQLLALTPTERSLDEYLSSLLEGLKRFDARDSLDADEIAWLIERGFRGSVALEDKIQRYARLGAKNAKDRFEVIRGLWHKGRLDTDRLAVYQRKQLNDADPHSLSAELALQVLEIRAFRERGIWRYLPGDGHSIELHGWMNLTPKDYVEAGSRGAIDHQGADTWPGGVVDWGWLLAFVQCGKLYE